MKDNKLQLIKAGSTSVINALGELIFTYALSLKLLKVTGSALGYGTSLFIGPIVGLLLAPTIGKVIDSYPHKKLAIIAQFLLIAVLTLYLFAYTVLRTPIFYTAIVAVILINIFSRLFSITYLSSTPQIVSKSSIQRLNSIQTTGVATASIIGAPIAGFLFGVIPFQFIILIEIITEFLTLLITWRTSFDEIKPRKNKSNSDNSNKPKVLDILLGQPQLLILIFTAMALNLSGISLQIGVPYVLLHTLKYSTIVSGNVEGIASFGVLIGGFIISLITIKHVFNFARKIYELSAILPLLLGIFIKVIPSYTLILFATFEFISSFMGAISDPPIFTYIQEVIPGEALGRVNTMTYTMVEILNPVGVLIYSTLFSKLNYQTVFLFNGIITALLIGILFVYLNNLLNRKQNI